MIIPHNLQQFANQENDPVTRTLSPCYDKIASKFDIFNIFFFDFGSMILFSYCVIAFGGITTSPGLWIVWGGMTISLAIGATFGFGHINPAVTFACMIKKQGRVSILNGLLLIISQLMGAFAGTYIAWSLNNQLIAPFPNIHSVDEVWETFGVQVLGSFIFVLCILILVSTDSQMCAQKLHIWATIPLCLISVCILLNLSLGTNPAQALAFQIAYYSFHISTAKQLSCIWSVVIGASIGGVLAGLFFQFIYRKYCRVYKEQLLKKQIINIPIIDTNPVRMSFLDQQNTQKKQIVNRKTEIQIL